MEAMGGGASFLDGEWESLCKLFSSEQDLSFDLLLGEPLMNPISQTPFFNQKEAIPSPNSNQCSSDLSYDSNNGSSPHYVNGFHNLMQPNFSEDQISSLFSFDYLLEEGLLMGQPGFPSVKEGPVVDPMDCSTKRNAKCIDDQLDSMETEVCAPKKRARVSKQAGKRKKKNVVVDIEEETNARNSNADMSDDESNESQEVINEGSKEILNMNGKRRASRGAATDPQSLYARRRRERINERLRILQTLVPNGTKVDISTMLEEAVSYVKFLQLQIKLLSSDETWMYAPLAYSGFDMGLYNNFSSYLPRQ
ncbi:hypothetical protein V2J09_011807 [Rumex salicifolius]